MTGEDDHGMTTEDSELYWEMRLMGVDPEREAKAVRREAIALYKDIDAFMQDPDTPPHLKEQLRKAYAKGAAEIHDSGPGDIFYGGAVFGGTRAIPPLDLPEQTPEERDE